MTDDLLSVTTDVRGHRVVVRAEGEVDMCTAPILADGLDRAAAPGATVEVDLAGVSFFGSAGVAVLGAAHERCVLRLVGLSPQVRQVLRLSGMDQLLTIAEYPAASGAG